MSEADRKICAMAAEHCSVEEYYDNKAVFTHHFNRQKVTQMLDEIDATDDRIAAAQLEHESIYAENRVKDKQIEELEILLAAADCPSHCTDGAYQDIHGEPVQCQFCYERKEILKW